MNKICVFCGSSPGSDDVYAEAAAGLGCLLATEGIGLVYGGASVGLMGVLADHVLKNKGKAYGVIPSFFSREEIAHKNLTELIFVDSMHERKLKLAAMSDGFIAMPGGYGTMDELFEMLTWSQLDLHQKPIGLFNINGYFDPLISFFDRMTHEGFVKPEHRQILLASSDPKELITLMANYKPIRLEKWLKRIKA